MRNYNGKNIKMDALLNSFQILRKYCEAEQYKGWDPYDGLNSKVFQAIPFLKRSAICRLVVIQGFKRCPFNLRRLAMVPKEYNAKGIGLFLSGYCNLYHAVETKPELEKSFGSKESLINKINEIAEILISLQSKGYSGACWGYNFDWQAGGKGMFLFPKYTPTVVATNFCATALMDAYEITRVKKYLDIALSSAQFVLKDLHRTIVENGTILSYSPLPGNDTVYNASILGSELLLRCYKYNSSQECLKVAVDSLDACCHGMNPDGSWPYGIRDSQSWKDSFHTGYNLMGLKTCSDILDCRYNEYIEKGFEYYIQNFFTNDGIPKYYNNKMYPIDIHCPGQLFVTLSRLEKFNEFRELADKVLSWTVKNMQDKKGYFYYQLKSGGISSKISYMRWSNAFMFNALSYFLKSI